MRMASRKSIPTRPAPEADRAPRSTRFVLAGREVLVLSVAAVDVLLSDLTSAERAVAKALLEGATNTEIARARNVSLRTVANQIASIFRKFGVSSRSELAACVGRGARPVAATRARGRGEGRG